MRAIEVLWACDEALRIIENYELPDAPAVEVVARTAIGYGATEAPRGLLYHGYRIDERVDSVPRWCHRLRRTRKQSSTKWALRSPAS